MKKLLIPFIFLASIAAGQFFMFGPNGIGFQCPPPVTSGGGTPVKKDEQATDEDYQNMAEDSTMQWASGNFTATSSYTITSVKVKLARADSAGTIKLHIFSSDGSKLPIADLASSAAINNSTLPDFPGDYVTFTLLATASISSGSTYCLVLEDSNNDGTTRVRVRTASAAGYAFGRSSNGSSWSVYSGMAWVFETWGY